MSPGGDVARLGHLQVKALGAPIAYSGFALRSNVLAWDTSFAPLLLRRSVDVAPITVLYPYIGG